VPPEFIAFTLGLSAADFDAARGSFLLQLAHVYGIDSDYALTYGVELSVQLTELDELGRLRVVVKNINIPGQPRLDPLPILLGAGTSTSRILSALTSNLGQPVISLPYEYLSPDIKFAFALNMTAPAFDAVRESFLAGLSDLLDVSPYRLTIDDISSNAEGVVAVVKLTTYLPDEEQPVDALAMLTPGGTDGSQSSLAALSEMLNVPITTQPYGFVEPVYVLLPLAISAGTFALVRDAVVQATASEIGVDPSRVSIELVETAAGVLEVVLKVTIDPSVGEVSVDPLKKLAPLGSATSEVYLRQLSSRLGAPLAAAPTPYMPEFPATYASLTLAISPEEFAPIANDFIDAVATELGVDSSRVTLDTGDGGRRHCHSRCCEGDSQHDARGDTCRRPRHPHA
jgi:hypothetical protein